MIMITTIFKRKFAVFTSNRMSKMVDVVKNTLLPMFRENFNLEQAVMYQPAFGSSLKKHFNVTIHIHIDRIMPRDTFDETEIKYALIIYREEEMRKCSKCGEYDWCISSLDEDNYFVHYCRECFYKMLE